MKEWRIKRHEESCFPTAVFFCLFVFKKSKEHVDFQSCQCLRTVGLCTLQTTVTGFSSHPLQEYFDLLSNFSAKQLKVQHRNSITRFVCHYCYKTVQIVLTFLFPGEDVSGGGVLVMFSGLEPQLDGDDPLILLYG